MFSMPVALALLLQLNLDYELLAVEDARGDSTRLIEALSSTDPDIQVQPFARSDVSSVPSWPRTSPRFSMPGRSRSGSKPPTRSRR